jgi:hypothetical protein
MPFLPAGVGAAVAGGVASAGASALIGGLSGGKQSSQAGAGAAQAQADLAPFRTAGTNALGVASDLAGANGPDAATAAGANFHTDPGYQFMMDQGLRSIGAKQGAAGMFDSGATQKAQMSFATGLADQSFSNYYNRLYNLSTLGETAAAGGAALAQGAGNTQANITGGIGAGLSNTVNSLFSNPNVVKGIGSLFGSGNSGASSPDTGFGLPGFVDTGQTQ